MSRIYSDRNDRFRNPLDNPRLQPGYLFCRASAGSPTLPSRLAQGALRHGLLGAERRRAEPAALPSLDLLAGHAASDPEQVRDQPSESWRGGSMTVQLSMFDIFEAPPAPPVRWCDLPRRKVMAPATTASKSSRSLRGNQSPLRSRCAASLARSIRAARPMSSTGGVRPSGPRRAIAASASDWMPMRRRLSRQLNATSTRPPSMAMAAVASWSAGGRPMSDSGRAIPHGR